MRNNTIIALISMLLLSIAVTGCKKQTETQSDHVKVEDQIAEKNPDRSIKTGFGEEETTTENEDWKYQTNTPELQSEIEADPNYSPEDPENIDDDYFGPETYDENETVVNIYFTNTENDLDKVMSIKALEKLSTEVQKYLNNEGYTDAEELKVVSGSGEKSDVQSSFIFTMDEYPDITVKVIYYYEMSQFGFEQVIPIK